MSRCCTRVVVRSCTGVPFLSPGLPIHRTKVEARSPTTSCNGIEKRESSMDLRQMEYLVALADEQQFTRAASVCNVSQSGLSAAIRSLEEELGATLFARTTRRVEPTDAGLALLPYARAHAGRGHGRPRRRRARDPRAVGPAARRRRAVPGHRGRRRPLLERFRRRYPLVDIHFTQAGSHELVGRCATASSTWPSSRPPST